VDFACRHFRGIPAWDLQAILGRMTQSYSATRSEKDRFQECSHGETRTGSQLQFGI
jgi:hypothetical protein